MKIPKYAWRRVTVYIIASMWLTGCANNETSASISSISNSNYAANYSNNTADVDSAPLQMDQPRTTTVFSGGAQSQMNKVSQKGNIIYNRSYNGIQKGSYSGITYQVKHGDTLFYIAWITGNDYLDLAQRNSIHKPYNLNIGQTLQVGKLATSIIDNAPSKTVLASDTNQINTGVVIAPVPTVNKKLTKSTIISNKNNSYHKSLNKQSVGKISLSYNGKLSDVGTVVATTVPVTVPSAALATTAYDSKAITGWRWPTNGKIVDNFSSADGGNKGIDISGSLGQPVLATASGKVVYAGNALRGYGNLVIIKHNEDYLSAYAHNDSMLVREQQKVMAGQKIATMGSSGTSTTKLHFEIRYKGKSVNPLHYLLQR